MQLLTTTEAAEYLRIKDRKLYELVAERQIPCTKVTGKWLFPRADLDRWLLAGMARPHGVIPAEPPLIVGGSHDPLLEWALLESHSGLAILPEGSAAGYRRFLQGGVIAAAIHFHDLDGRNVDANVQLVSREPTLYDAVLVAFATRQQGLLVAPGNPLKLASIADVVAVKARIAMRPEGAGAQQLLQAQLTREKIAVGKLKRAEGTAPTGADIAQTIRFGHAECGIATRTVAQAAGLDFIPMATERFDLIVRQRDYFRAPMQSLLWLVRQPQFAQRAEELGGLSVEEAGNVRWAP